MKERIAYATLVGLVAYAAIATDLYLPAIPAMVSSFGVSESDGQLTLSLFMFGFAGGQLFFGPLSDYYGRIPVVTAGTVFFLITSVACTLAFSMEFMWLARFLQGTAAASGPVIARAIVRDRYQGSRAAEVMAVLAAAMAVIPLIAPTLGSWILVWFHWRATYVALVIFALLVLLGLRQFEESAPAVGQGGIGINKVLRQFSRCLSQPRFIGYQICGTASYSGLMSYLSTVPFFTRDVFALKPQYFGYAFAVTVMGFMFGALTSSRLVPRLGQNTTMGVGVCLSVAGALLQFHFAKQQPTPTLALAICSFSVFFGIGLTSANASMGAISLFPKAAGAASAVFGFLHATTAALVGLLAGQLYDGTLMPTASIMLACSTIGLLGIPLARERDDPLPSASL